MEKDFRPFELSGNGRDDLQSVHSRRAERDNDNMEA
jgi:hypothetical protein